MKVLYIGQYSEGTTSKMRADQINLILDPEVFDVIDTHIPFFRTPRLLRSFGFRYKKGPLISSIHRYVAYQSQNKNYDLVWIDKAVFLKPDLVRKLKKKTKKIVHFTPDMAFYENRSSLFESAINDYDFLVTTKRAEMENYKRFIPTSKLIMATQGFSKLKHYPVTPFSQKDKAVVFIGLAEKSRFRAAEFLISKGVHLKVAGMGWEKFAEKNSGHPNFHYYGKGIYGENYAKFISSSMFGLGLLSKRFPEYHTTRTFEIPACGTALITERNEETLSFYNENEVIFYSSLEEMLQKINYFLNKREELQKLTQKGLERVRSGGFDYESILKKILDQVLS